MCELVYNETSVQELAVAGLFLINDMITSGEIIFNPGLEIALQLDNSRK
jgi:hypothetical protein